MNFLKRFLKIWIVILGVIITFLALVFGIGYLMELSNKNPLLGLSLLVLLVTSFIAFVAAIEQ